MIAIIHCKRVNMKKHKILFTSDSHFGHKNILEFCNRPFQNTHEMNETLIKNWNSVVGPKDEIYHLGDFGLASPNYIRSILERLNGRKFLIVGNHDKSTLKCSDMFEWVKHLHTLKIQDKRARGGVRKVILCHYAMRVWDASHYGSYHLYGHSHGTLPENDTLSFDVGVDSWDFTPITYEQVREKMEKKMS